MDNFASDFRSARAPVVSQPILMKLFTHINDNILRLRSINVPAFVLSRTRTKLGDRIASLLPDQYCGGTVC